MGGNFYQILELGGTTIKGWRVEQIKSVNLLLMKQLLIPHSNQWNKTVSHLWKTFVYIRTYSLDSHYKLITFLEILKKKLGSV